MARRVEITSGQRFGRLVAVERVFGLGLTRWLFRCDCGTERVMRVSAVKSNFTKRGQASCGCQRVESMKNGYARTHGHTSNGMKTPTYISWKGMKGRCYDPNHISFPYYGEIGIEVCKRWWKFENFLEDMGPRPPGMTLDRIEVNGDYEPGNCRWTDAEMQGKNKRWRE